MAPLFLVQLAWLWLFEVFDCEVFDVIMASLWRLWRLYVPFVASLASLCPFCGVFVPFMSPLSRFDCYLFFTNLSIF